MAATLDLRSSAVRREGSTPSPGTRKELKGFEEVEMRDALRAC